MPDREGVPAQDPHRIAPGPGTRYGTEGVRGIGDRPAKVNPRERVILIVDDEPDLTDALRQLFETEIEGVRVLVAGSGEEAIPMMEREHLDLIICDYRMPGVDGLGLLAEARRLLPGVPRILLTGAADVQVAARAINDERVENFVLKPWSAEDALARTRAAIERHREGDHSRRAFTRALDRR